MGDTDRAVNTVTKVRHVKSKSYVTEYADRTAVLISDAAGIKSVTVIFGRDTAEIIEEDLSPPEGKPAQVKAGQIETYRLNLASISLPEVAARAMAEGILRSLDVDQSK